MALLALLRKEVSDGVGDFRSPVRSAVIPFRSSRCSPASGLTAVPSSSLLLLLFSNLVLLRPVPATFLHNLKLGNRSVRFDCPPTSR